MKATVLIDNIANDNLIGEWGLSILIEYENHKILLDGGTTGRFMDNASKMAIDLNDVDTVVLSHAHYDHADGLVRFFEYNKKCKLYVRDTVKEDCYGKKWIFSKYIGVSRGFLAKYKGRIVYASGKYTLMEGVYLVPHTTPDLEKIGAMNLLYRKKGFLKYVPDDFDHEQSLVFRTNEGLVIFNSCSHGGADNIINEIKEAFPNEKIIALIGGFHLFRASDEYVVSLAERIKETGIELIYTGHCSGKRATELLKEELGDNKVTALCSGLVINFD